MSDPREPQDRLDSWKAIADYLGRDVATVRRWEKSLGLPIRRVPGGPGRSVFAFRHEVDAWLKSSQTAETDPVPSPPVDVTPEILPAPTPAPAPVRRGWPALAAIAVLLMVAAAAILGGRLPGMDDSPLELELKPDRITARGADGEERWHHAFAPSQRMLFENSQAVTPLRNRRGFLVGAASQTSASNGNPGGGELLWLSEDGVLQRKAVFRDRLSYGHRTYGGPWVLANYRVSLDVDPEDIAVVVRHYQWWPSIVTRLGPGWQPAQKFVNAGWVEHVAWTRPDRLLIAGFYNPLDGGMVALLDADAMQGESPRHSSDPTFVCTSCGADAPLRYVVLPRSELNRVLTAPFNRAQIQISGDRLVVRTVEEPSGQGYAAEALYEFTMDLELISATYGDRYWDRHKALEASGQLDHPRERCPEQRGPRVVHVWQRDTGWRKITPADD